MPQYAAQTRWDSGSTDTTSTYSPGSLVVPLFVLKRSLRAVLLRDPVLFWRQQRNASGFLLYVFIFRSLLQASYKYDRETQWPVLATRPTMIDEAGRTARPPRVLTDERG
jgi:hypothetical protein